MGTASGKCLHFIFFILFCKNFAKYQVKKAGKVEQIFRIARETIYEGSSSIWLLPLLAQIIGDF